MNDLAELGDAIHLSGDVDGWCDQWFYLGESEGDGRHIVAQRYSDGTWYATTVVDITDVMWHRASPECRENGPYYEETPYDES